MAKAKTKKAKTTKTTKTGKQAKHSKPKVDVMQGTTSMPTHSHLHIDDSAPLLDVLSRAIAVAVDREKFGNQRKADKGDITVNADKSMLSLTKRLLDSPELRAVAAVDREVQQYLFKVGLPSFFKDGIYLVPSTLLDTVDAKLHAFAAQRQVAVDEFIAAYPARIEEMKLVLRDMFDADDYDSPSAVRQQFAFRWRYMDLGVPDKVQTISSAVYNAAKERDEKESAAIAEQLRQSVRATGQELIKHFLDRLQPGPDGKPKVFRSSSLDNLREFFDLFEHRNLTGDKKMQQQVVNVARQVIAGVTPDAIREDEDMRASLAQQLAPVAKLLDSMVVTAGRQIILED
jgi:Protein of unknown function (DUF3150)